MLKEKFRYTTPGRRPAQQKPVDPSCIAHLVSVLEPHPRGLRRWSVMRAMRQRAERANREITPKFEDEVERMFRRHCEGDVMRTGLTDTAEELFFRPKDTAGEVWAVHIARAQAWLETPHVF